MASDQRPDFGPIRTLHAKLQSGSGNPDRSGDWFLDEQLYLIWIQGSASADAPRPALSRFLEHPLFHGRHLETVVLPGAADVALMYFGGDWSYRRYLEISDEVSQALCRLDAGEGMTSDGSEASDRGRTFEEALGAATGGREDLRPHYWPYYMLRWVGRVGQSVPHLFTRRSYDGGPGVGGLKLTVLERDLFRSASFVLNVVTRELVAYECTLLGPNRVVVSGNLRDARRVAEALRAALPGLEAIRDREKIWGDDFAGDHSAIQQYYGPLDRLLDLLRELGMRFDQGYELYTLELGPRSQVQPPGGNVDLRRAYGDLYRLLLPRVNEIELPLTPPPPIIVEQCADVLRRLEAVTGRLPRGLCDEEVKDPGPAAPNNADRLRIESSDKTIVSEISATLDHKELARPAPHRNHTLGEKPADSSNWFGLELWRNDRAVVRPGIDNTKAEFGGSELDWRLFEGLMAKKGRVLTYEEIENLWSEYGSGPPESRNIIHQKLSKINKLIKCLSVVAKSVRGSGYKLVDATGKEKV